MFHQLPATDDTLIISAVQFQSSKQAIRISSNQILDVGVIKLNYHVRQLESVEITGRLSKSYKSDYSFFGNKTETPSINIPQFISTITKELIDDKMEFVVQVLITQIICTIADLLVSQM